MFPVPVSSQHKPWCLGSVSGPEVILQEMVLNGAIGEVVFCAHDEEVNTTIVHTVPEGVGGAGGERERDRERERERERERVEQRRTCTLPNFSPSLLLPRFIQRGSWHGKPPLVGNTTLSLRVWALEIGPVRDVAGQII